MLPSEKKTRRKSQAEPCVSTEPRIRSQVMSSRPRKKSDIAELVEWFWKFLEKETVTYTTPEFFRHMKNAKTIKERGYDLETVKRTIEYIKESGTRPDNLFAIEWTIGGKTFYEVVADPMNSAPPIYEQLEYQRWLERNESFTRESSGGM